MEIKRGTIVEVVSDCKSKGRIGEVLRVWNNGDADVRLEREPFIDPHKRTYTFSKKSLNPIFSGRAKETATPVDNNFQYIIYDREPVGGDFSVFDSKEELKKYMKDAVDGCDYEDAMDYLDDVEVYKVTGLEKVTFSLGYDIDID